MFLAWLWLVPCCENVSGRFPMFQSAMSGVSGVSGLAGFLDSLLGWLNQFCLGNFSYWITRFDFTLLSDLLTGSTRSLPDVRFTLANISLCYHGMVSPDHDR